MRSDPENPAEPAGSRALFALIRRHPLPGIRLQGGRDLLYLNGMALSPAAGSGRDQETCQPAALRADQLRMPTQSAADGIKRDS